MYGLETNELMVFKENNKAFVLDKISHNNFRLSTNLELNNIVEHPNLKKQSISLEVSLTAIQMNA